MAHMKKIVIAAMLLIASIGTPFSVRAQYGDFVLKDKYSDITTTDGVGYLSIPVYDSTKNVDDIAPLVYSVLSETYPEADIHIVGKRIVRMDNARSGRIVLPESSLKLLIDFSIVIEIKDKKINGVTSEDIHPSIRIRAPRLKRSVAFDPYDHPEIQVYVDNIDELKTLLMGRDLTGTGTIGDYFFRHIHLCIYHNIDAEINHDYYEEKGYNSLLNKYRK